MLLAQGPHTEADTHSYLRSAATDRGTHTSMDTNACAHKQTTGNKKIIKEGFVCVCECTSKPETQFYK